MRAMAAQMSKADSAVTSSHSTHERLQVLEEEKEKINLDS
jgi:hypothetical protein